VGAFLTKYPPPFPHARVKPATPHPKTGSQTVMEGLKHFKHQTVDVK
jgi:hypothetical protein